MAVLQWAAEQAASGPWPAAQITRTVRQRIAAAGGAVDYVEVSLRLSPVHISYMPAQAS